MSSSLRVTLSAICASLLLVVCSLSLSAIAATVDLSPSNEPAICSGQPGTWTNNTYTCAWDYPLQLPPGIKVISDRPITLLSHNGADLTDVEIGSNQNPITLQASGGNRIILAGSRLFGDITNTPNVTLTGGTTVDGHISILDRLEINQATVTGSISANNGIEARALSAQSSLHSSNGAITLASSSIQGLISSSCCKVTITEDSIIDSGVRTPADEIEITDSQVRGDLTAGNNIIRLRNTTVYSGNISAGSNNIEISGGTLNANIVNANEVKISNNATFTGDIYARYLVTLIDSVVTGTIEKIATHEGLYHVKLSGSFVYGDVLVRTDWGTITGDWPNSAIYGYCEYKTVTPNLCSAAPPLDTCDAITELTKYGVIGYSGFIPNQSGRGNCNGKSCSTMNGNPIQDPNNTNGNTPTPSAEVALLDNLTFPYFEPLAFPASTSNRSLNNQNIVEPGDYDTLTFDSNASYSFTPGIYRINRLVISGQGKNAPTVTFAAGDYFINNVDLSNNAVIKTDGSVNFFVGNRFQAGNGLIVNRDGSVSDFRINLYKNVSVSVGNSNQGVNNRSLLDFNGIIYGPFANNNVTFGDSHNIQGAILVGGQLEVGNSTDFTYTREVENAVNQAFGCLPATGPGVVDHFRIRHPGQLVSCLAAPVTIQACADADCNTLFPDPIQLSITSSHAASSWSDVSGNTSGNQTLVTIPAGEAQFALSLVDGGNTELRLDDLASVVRCFEGQTNTPSDCQVSFTTAGLTIADANLNPINSPYSGVPFTSYLWAIETDTNTGACQARVEGPQSVEIAVSCENPSQCFGVAYSLNEENLQPSFSNNTRNYSTIDVIFDENGRAPLTNSYPDVGALRMHARLTLDESSEDEGITNPEITLTGHSIQNYVVRPYRLHAVALNANGEWLPDSNNELSETDNAFVAAGEPFSVIIQSENSEGNLTPSFGLEIESTRVSAEIAKLVRPEHGNPGYLGNKGSFTLSNQRGIYISDDITWSEVGVFEIRADSINYLKSGDAFERPSSPVGRFYPHHFEVVTSEVVNAYSGVNEFTYMGHDAIQVDFTLAARNANNATTQNYSDLDPSGSAAVMLYVAELDSDANELEQLADRLSLVGADSSFINRVEPSWHEGELEYTNANVVFHKRDNRVMDGPYPDLRIGLEITDERDNRSFLDADRNLDTYEGNTVQLHGSLNLRYGRMRLDNISGPEDQALPVIMRAEYWNGRLFVDHIDDDCSELEATTTETVCTAFNYGELLISDDLPVSVDGASGVLEKGFLPFKGIFLQPDSTFVGDFEFSYEAPEWLQFPWRSVTDENPHAFAEFGQYSGNRRVIYWLEIN